MKRIYDKNEIVLGRHGVYIRQGSMAGTLLPQVAIENGWDVDEFLEYTSQYKAGIGRSGWKRAELYIYEGVVFEEKDRVNTDPRIGLSLFIIGAVCSIQLLFMKEVMNIAVAMS